jgi:hypothetical protein
MPRRGCHQLLLPLLEAPPDSICRLALLLLWVGVGLQLLKAAGGRDLMLLLLLLM